MDEDHILIEYVGLNDQGDWMWCLRKFFRPFIINGEQYQYNDSDPIKQGIYLSRNIKNVKIRINDDENKEIIIEKEKGKEIVIEDIERITDNCQLKLSISTGE